MKLTRNKQIWLKVIWNFALVLAVFALICSKMDVFMTPLVSCTTIQRGELVYKYTGLATITKAGLLVSFPTEQEKYWSEDETLKLNDTSESFTITKSNNREDGMTELLLKLEDIAILTQSDVEVLEISYTKSLGTFGQTIPLECLHVDDFGESYFLLAEKTNSKFMPLITRKIIVSVKENDGRLAAIVGLIPKDGEVIRYASSELVSEQKVRVS